MPYGPAPAYCFPFAELSLYILFVACLVYAARKGARHVGYLFGGLAFGLILEYVNVNANLGYTYGKFWVMFGQSPKDIPLCIGVGWGVIMYTARLFSDRLGLPLWTAAALDALLAISIDGSMDTVAYRLHMWHWSWDPGFNPLTKQWFGVPWGNFFGWLLVVFFYSSFCRLLERTFLRKTSLRGLKAGLVPLLAVLLSQACLYITLIHIDKFLNEQFGIRSIHRLIVFGSFLTILAIRGLRSRRPVATQMPFLAWFVPMWLHGFFFAWLFIGGFYRENALLTTIATLNILLAMGIHLFVFRRKESMAPVVA
jgi:uncharacterized membrane protein